jgi:hypothetical protein
MADDDFIRPSALNEVARADVLETAAARVRAGLVGMRRSCALFVESALEAASALATARGLFPSNVAFGAWCAANGLGEDALSADDRAALIDFGGDIERARQVLEASQRTSLRLIRIHEWKPFSQPAKTPEKIDWTSLRQTGDNARQRAASATVTLEKEDYSRKDHPETDRPAGQPVAPPEISEARALHAARNIAAETLAERLADTLRSGETSHAEDGEVAGLRRRVAELETENASLKIEVARLQALLEGLSP